MHKGWRKTLLLLAATCVFWGLSGCSTIPANPPAMPGETPGTTSTPPATELPQVFRLGYSADDALNPYLAESAINTQLGELLYEGLYSFAADMTPLPQLANELIQAERTVRIRLRTGAVFSDGSTVMPADVIASFDKAKIHAVYGPTLAAFTNVQADADGLLVFALSGGEPEAAACLSFPILKASELDVPQPLGTGRYAFRQKDTGAELVRQGNISGFAVIELAPAENTETLLYGLESGMVSYFRHTLAEGTLPRTSSATVATDMTSLVFLGVNGNRSGLSQAAVRQALSAAINREVLCRSAFDSYARPALAPWHSQWGRMAQATMPLSENAVTARELLTGAGYTIPGETTAAGTPAPKLLELELLVNTDNPFRTAAAELIRTQLETVGITVTVKTVSFTEYAAAIKRGSFDVYIGEIRQAANMSLTPWLTSGGGAAAGIRQDNTAQVYTNYRDGTADIAAVLTAFGTEVPYIPLCWRQSITLYRRDLAGVSVAPMSCYHALDKWSF